MLLKTNSKKGKNKNTTIIECLDESNDDVNVLFNTIVDMAISHYHDYIFNEGGIFSGQEEKKINS